MFDGDEDFDIEDVDFCFNDQNINHHGEKAQSTISSPQRKIPKNHELEFVHSIIEKSAEESTLPTNLHRHSNILGVSKNNNVESPRNIQSSKRKFPGPAGLLPDRVNFQSTSRSVSNFPDNSSRDKLDIEQASSQYSSIFETIAWQCAFHDIKQSGLNGIQSCNIAHLKRAAFSSKSKALKYPFLVAAVSNMDTGQELFVTLKDPSGDIQAYINSEVLEQFPEELQRGCVVLLKKVGVLKSGQGRGIYLLITPNNLAVIYPPDKGISQLNELKESCCKVDFTSLDVSLNTSLDVSNNNSFHPGTSQNTRNNMNSSTPNPQQPRHFARSNMGPQTSTPNSHQIQRGQVNHSGRKLYQQPTRVQDSSTSSFRESDKPSFAQFRSNPTTQPSLASDDNNVSVSNSQHGNNDEDLSTTVNSLLEGLDTDSIFDDF